MTHIKILLPFILFIFILSSCKKPVYLDDPIVGVWIYDSYDTVSNSLKYRSADNLDPDLPGYIFHDNTKLNVNAMIGGCATPPISYVTYNGSWHYLSDSTIQISAEYWEIGWGEENLEYNLKIIDISSEYLNVIFER